MKKVLGAPVFPVLTVIVALLGAVSAHAKVDYHLNKAENPSDDEQDAYTHIAAAMDSAVFLYNKYTHLSKHIEVYYNTGVQTADGSYNGTMRFGSNRSYMTVRTAIHEMGHIMGMGTTSEYRNMFVNKVFQGPKTQALVKELSGDPEAEIHGDDQHFWPYGLNYDNELHSEQDLIISCQIVESMYQEMFKEAFYMNARVEYLSDGMCMGMTASNSIEMMDCSEEGTLAKIWSVGEDPATYRIEFGDRVIDVPNESTAAGVTIGTYSWNGGAHQRYVFEVAPVNTPNAFYLQNYKSKLYLLPSGKNVVQDQRGRDVDSGIWRLEEVGEVVASSGSTAAASSGSTVSSGSSSESGPAANSSSGTSVGGSSGVATQAIRRQDRPVQVQRSNRLVDVKGRAVKWLKKMSRGVYYNE